MPLIQLKNIQVSFGGPALLDQLSLTIEPNERICLIGRNGAGKSTLMKVLNREIKADSGEIIVEKGAVIAQLEQEVIEQQQNLDSFTSSATKLKDLVKKSERQLAEHQRQLTMVKTTDSVQKATSAITDNFSASNSKLLSAKDSLERIKQKQQDFDDRMVAADKLHAEGSDQSLKAKLAEAGIGQQQSNANSVLARLKAKQNS